MIANNNNLFCRLLNAMTNHLGVSDVEKIESTIGVYSVGKEEYFSQENKTLKFTCWDFAGQDSYQNTHSVCTYVFYCLHYINKFFIIIYMLHHIVN